MTLHAEELVALPREVVLREADEAECQLGGMSGWTALAMSFAGSMEAYAIKSGEDVLAYWGFAPATTLGRICHMWMLTLPAVDDHKIAFARVTRRIVARMSSVYPILQVVVDPRHHLALKWLESMNFRTICSEGDFTIMQHRRGM